MASLSESTFAAAPEALTEEEKREIRAQLEKLLATPFFSHSHRFPSFLRFVVDTTMEGHADLLKERTIGLEIFSRSADYDTATDPIVRVTAAEIRKRIAQYYQEPGRQQELRISLPPGSYVPQFQFPVAAEPLPPVPAVQASAAAGESPAPASAELESAPPERASRLRFGRYGRVALAAGVLVLLLAGAAWLGWRHVQRSAFTEFWSPILGSSEPVLFCVADQTKYTEISLRDAADPSRQVMLKDNLTAIVIDDLSTIIKVAGVMQAAGKSYSLRGEGATSLMDLRSGPSVVIGAFDNAWTLRMLRPLRYHFANNADMTAFRIVDSTAPASTHWVLDRNQQLSTNNYRDYALVARFTDETTGKPTLVAAGIGRGGTITAGEFLTNPDLLRAVRNQRPSSGAKNVEVVLSTQIIDGEPGTPHIEAIYYW